MPGALRRREMRRIEADTWNVIGMAGTGSHTVEVDDQWVPEDWTFAYDVPGPDNGPHLRRNGLRAVAVPSSVSSTQLGAARCALDLANELLPARTRPVAGRSPAADNAYVQRRLMRAEAQWAACRVAVLAGLEEVWADGHRSRTLTPRTRVALSIASTHATETAVEIIDAIVNLLGTMVAGIGRLLGACLRDANALRSHIAASTAVYEHAARVHLGQLDADFMV